MKHPGIPQRIRALPVAPARSRRSKKTTGLTSSTGIQSLAIIAIFSLWAIRSKITTKRSRISWRERDLPNPRTNVSKLGEALQSRQVVILLQSRCFGFDLGRVEFDLFRIFFRLDLNETVERMLHRFGQLA